VVYKPALSVYSLLCKVKKRANELLGETPT
jgi:hypothetical protein